jgi:hypothetical protein
VPANSESDPRLDVVGAVEAVQTVSAHHPLLFPDQLIPLNVEAVIAHRVDNIPEGLDKLLAVLELVVFALFVEIVELVAQVGHYIGLTAHQRFVKIAQHHLFRLLLAKQVDGQHTTVDLLDFGEVEVESAAGEGQGSLDHHITSNPINSHLRKESRHTTYKNIYLPLICKCVKI